MFTFRVRSSVRDVTDLRWGVVMECLSVRKELKGIYLLSVSNFVMFCGLFKYIGSATSLAGFRIVF